MVVRRKKNSSPLGEVEIRVLSVQEQAAAEEAWARSPEKAALDDKRRRASERLDALTGGYSRRC